MPMYSKKLPQICCRLVESRGGRGKSEGTVNRPRNSGVVLATAPLGAVLVTSSSGKENAPSLLSYVSLKRPFSSVMRPCMQFRPTRSSVATAS